MIRFIMIAICAIILSSCGAQTTTSNVPAVNMKDQKIDFKHRVFTILRKDETGTYLKAQNGSIHKLALDPAILKMSSNYQFSQSKVGDIIDISGKAYIKNGKSYIAPATATQMIIDTFS